MDLVRERGATAAETRLLEKEDFGWLPTVRTCGCSDGRLNCLSREELSELSSTVINVHQRQRWREHHGGRFIPQVPEKFIRLFSHTGETVLDPFCGSGTTNVIAKQLGRNSIGFDVNPNSVQVSLERIAAVAVNGEQTCHVVTAGNCVELLPLLPQNSVDLAVTSPPYFDIVDYGDQGPDQWGNLHDYPAFLDRMQAAFAALHRVVKPGGFVVIVTQDVYKKAAKCPIHADYIQICQGLGFEVISTQVYILNYSTGGRLVYGYPKAYYPKNDHEFILIFQKMSPDAAS
ncbi:MAG: site-specific DNA-methyltransferase [Chloroflexi bacterium]|nr:site-specific DNA-methyltransferase [Chloroflexota bacterium]